MSLCGWTDDGLGPKGGDAGQDAAQDPERHRQLRQRPAPREGGRGDLFDRHTLRKPPGVARAAGIGRKRHAPAARQHGLGQRLGRKHVPAGAPGSDHQTRCASGQRAPPSGSVTGLFK